MEAIRSNDVEVLRVMFRNGSLSPNAQLNVQGYTILHLASAAKATAAVEVAVKHGTDKMKSYGNLVCKLCLTSIIVVVT